MGTSDRSSKDPGRRLPQTIMDFSANCTLNPAGKLLILKVDRIVEGRCKSFEGFARELDRMNLKSPPNWARLQDGGEKLTSGAKTKASRMFGAGAGPLPYWPEIVTILNVCEATEHISEIASLWKASKGDGPPGYDGNYIDVSQAVRDVTETLREVEEAEAELGSPPEVTTPGKLSPSAVDNASADMLNQRAVENDRLAIDKMVNIIGNYASQNAELKLRVDQQEVEKEANRRRISQLEARVDAFERCLSDQGARLEGHLQANGILIPKQVSIDSPVGLIARNEIMFDRLLAGKVAAAADKARILADPRLHVPKPRASNLRATLAMERQSRERTHHIAATLLTFFAGPAVPKDWHQLEHMRKLSLPREVCRLFELRPPEVQTRQQDLMDRSLAFYLKAFLILSHGGNPRDLPADLARLLRDGSLPCREVVDSFFEARDDVDRANALLDLIESDQKDPPPKVGYNELNAATLVMHALPSTA